MEPITIHNECDADSSTGDTTNAGSNANTNTDGVSATDVYMRTSASGKSDGTVLGTSSGMHQARSAAPFEGVFDSPKPQGEVDLPSTAAIRSSKSEVTEPVVQQTRDTHVNEGEATQVQDALMRSPEVNPQSRMLSIYIPGITEELSQRPNPVNTTHAAQGQNPVRTRSAPEPGRPSTTVVAQSIEPDIIAERRNSAPARDLHTVSRSADSSHAVEADETHTVTPQIPQNNSDAQPTSEDASPNEENRQQIDKSPNRLSLVSKNTTRKYWLALIAAIIVAACQLMFWNGVVTPRTVLLVFMKIDSRWTIFLIVFMGTLMTVALTWLITATFESMKWRLSLRRGGIALLDFIALSQSTSLWTLVKIVVIRPWKTCRGSVASRFRIYSLMRLTLYIFTFGLTVILCIDMDVEPIYIQKGNMFTHPGGLIPINLTNYESIIPATKFETAAAILGHAHINGSDSILQMITLQQVEYTPLHEDSKTGYIWSSYTGNIFPATSDYSVNDIKALNATSDDFFTSYRSPYYQIRAFEAAGDLNYTGARVYGCGEYTFVVRAHEVNDSGYLFLSYTSDFDQHKGSLNTIRRTVFFQVRQMYADMTFSFQQQSVPVLLENQVEGHYIRIRADDYLRVLDSLYPVGGSPYDFNKSCFLFGIGFPLLHAGRNPTKWEVYLLPLLAQQNGIYETDSRPILDTAIRRQSYRISANVTSLWIFLGVTAAVITCCIVLSCFNPMLSVPEACCIPEFDLASRLQNTSGIKILENLSTRELEDLRNCTIINTLGAKPEDHELGPIQAERDV